MALSVASQSVLQKQRILASFYEVLVPKLQALGQVGTLAQQRLAMLMADAGVMEGTPTPASEDELNMVVGQAVAALKRYVTSSMMAPMVAPRSSSAGAPLPPGAPPHFVLPNPSTPQPPPEGSAEAAAAAAAAKLHACKNCQKAKTACMDQRPCQRCVRLGIPCDDDQKKVKRACGSCKRAKVKCDLDDKPLGVSCGRCTRLNLPCTPHVPNKKKRTGAAASDAADALLGDVADAIGLEPLEASGPLGGGPAGGFGEGLGFDMGGGGDAPLGSLEEVCDQLLKDSGSLPSGTFADPAALALDPDAIGVTRMSASEMLPQRLSLNSEGLPVGRSRDASMAGLSDIIKGSGMSGAGSLSASVLGSLSGIGGGGLGSASASFSGVPLPPEEERPGASPCAPLLPFDEVMKTERWSGVVHELNARVLQTRLERRTLWLATTDVPAPPAVVAAGYRQLLRTWGTNDPLVCQITELSHGGGPEEPVAHCSVCFEQIVHMHCKPPWPYEPRDFVLRSVRAPPRPPPPAPAPRASPRPSLLPGVGHLQRRVRGVPAADDRAARARPPRDPPLQSLGRHLDQSQPEGAGLVVPVRRGRAERRRRDPRLVEAAPAARVGAARAGERHPHPARRREPRRRLSQSGAPKCPPPPCPSPPVPPSPVPHPSVGAQPQPRTPHVYCMKRERL